MAGTVCNFATQLKFFFDCDDALDVSLSEAPPRVIERLLPFLRFSPRTV